MLSFVWAILLHLLVISRTFSGQLSPSNNIQHAPSINKYRRSLLPKNSYHFITNITIEINEISTFDSNPAIIETIYNQLNAYYNTTYNSSLAYNLSVITYTTSDTTNSIELILILLTKNAISRDDMQQLQQYIDDNISSDNLYTVTITHFTEKANSGDTNDLNIEILIIVFVLLFVVIFIVIWVWTWRRRVKTEVYFIQDYKDGKPSDNEFPNIKPQDSHEKKQTEIEMVDNVGDVEVTGNEVYDEDDEDDPEINIDAKKDNNDGDNNINMEKERDEDDEKAEELPETVNVGENIVIEDDD